MTTIEIVGWVATGTGTVLGLPQVVRLVRTRSVEGMSLPTWQAWLAVNLACDPARTPDRPGTAGAHQRAQPVLHRADPSADVPPHGPVPAAVGSARGSRGRGDDRGGPHARHRRLRCDRRRPGSRRQRRADPRARPCPKCRRGITSVPAARRGQPSPLVHLGGARRRCRNRDRGCRHRSRRRAEPRLVARPARAGYGRCSSQPRPPPQERWTRPESHRPPAPRVPPTRRPADPHRLTQVRRSPAP